MKKYEGLKSMFNSQTNYGSLENKGDADESDQVTGTWFKCLKDAICDPMTEAYLAFYCTVLPNFTISFCNAWILLPTLYIP